MDYRYETEDRDSSNEVLIDLAKWLSEAKTKATKEHQRITLMSHSIYMRRSWLIFKKYKGSIMIVTQNLPSER